MESTCALTPSFGREGPKDRLSPRDQTWLDPTLLVHSSDGTPMRPRRQVADGHPGATDPMIPSCPVPRIQQLTPPPSRSELIRAKY